MDAQLRTVVCAILNYWLENPNARDTSRGIGRWWIGRLGATDDRVESALKETVLEGFVEEILGPDGNRSYRLSPNRAQRIKAFIHG